MNAPMKRCPQCGNEYPATTEYFYKASKPRADGSFGLRSRCKMCTDQRNKQWKQEHPEYAEWARQYGKRKYWENPELANQHYKEWREANLEYSRQRVRDYYHANKDKERARHNRWRRERPQVRKATQEAFYQRHPDYKRRKAHEYYNRPKYVQMRRAHSRRRKALKRAAGTFTVADIQAQYKRQKGCCYYCHCKVGQTYHIEHVIPLSRGGTNTPDNIVIACSACNLHKHNRLPHEWPEGGRLL